jgi:hypothetical protein
MSGQSVKFIVTDNSITYIFTWSYNSIQHSIVRDIAVVEIEPVSPGAVNLIVRAPRFGYNPATGGIINERIYTARFYCTNSFDTKLNDAIGNTTLASLGIGGMAGVTVAQAASMLGSGDKVFIAPYCSDSEPKILDGETDDWGYTPRFVGESATAHAKAAAVLRAFEGETFALMHTPGQMHTPDQSGRQIVIDMYDSAGDGWDHSGALSITINGVNISNARLSSGSSGRYTFSTDAGDAVNMYWTGNSGSYHGENAFVVYYADTPPVPAFNSVSWSGSNALLFRLTDSLSNADLNQHLGSF